MQERLDTDKQAGQSQEKETDRTGKDATWQMRGRPKGMAHSVEKPDQPRESGAAAAARLFRGAHKRKPEAQTEEAPALRYYSPELAPTSLDNAMQACLMGKIMQVQTPVDPGLEKTGLAKQDSCVVPPKVHHFQRGGSQQWVSLSATRPSSTNDQMIAATLGEFLWPSILTTSHGH